MVAPGVRNEKEDSPDIRGQSDLLVNRKTENKKEGKCCISKDFYRDSMMPFM